LQYPDRIFNILVAVRAAVPKHIPVTAKIRLGFDKPEMCLQNAAAVEAAGIETMTVHCRTKTDMYKPPAFWEWIPKIKAHAPKLQIVANGEIWNAEDLQLCQAETGCDHLMIGRGAIANPFIFRQCKGEAVSSEWQDLKTFLPRFFDASTEFKSEFFAQSRTKQWLNQIGKRNPLAAQVFDNIKIEKNPAVFRQKLLELTA
jgi:tRNA-dihydrouridine synthase C